jgi:hypothetical protein
MMIGRCREDCLSREVHIIPAKCVVGFYNCKQGYVKQSWLLTKASCCHCQLPHCQQPTPSAAQAVLQADELLLCEGQMYCKYTIIMFVVVVHDD